MRVVAFVSAALALAPAVAAEAAPWTTTTLGTGDWSGVAAGVDASGAGLLSASAFGGGLRLWSRTDGGAPMPLAPPPGLAGHVHDSAVNARGAAVIAIAGERPGPLRVSVREPGGAFEPPVELPNSDGAVQSIDVALADTGTALVVWRSFGEAAETDYIVGVVRPAGGGFSGPFVIAASSQPAQFGGPPRAAIGADGRLEVFFSRDRRIQRAVRPAGATAFQEPQTLLTTSRDNRVRDLALATAPDGRAVLVYDDGIPGTRLNGLWALRRPSADAAFGAPEELARTSDEELLPEVALTPDGGALVAYRQERHRGREEFGHTVLRVRRAIGTGPFGRDQTVSTTEVVVSSKRRRDIGGLDLDVNARGEAVLGWTTTCSACGDVAMAAVAVAGGRFRTPQALSDPGHTIRSIALALAPDGDAVALWPESPGLFSRSARLRLAAATHLPGAEMAPLDRRPARGSLVMRAADVRAAVRTGRLPVRLRCSEACGATVSLPGVVWRVLGSDAADVSRRLILERAGSGSVTLRFRRRSHRRALARVIRRGPIAVRALLSDRAGNLTRLQYRVRVP